MKLQCSVIPYVGLRVRRFAASEGISMSAMTALLVREAVDVRLRKEELVRREFELPIGRWIDMAHQNWKP